MVKEAYVSFEIAKLLKEKGFDEPCHSHYWFKKDKAELSFYIVDYLHDWNESLVYVSRPTHQMALAWLREKGVLLWVYPAIPLPAADNRTFRWMWDGKKQRHDARHFGNLHSYDTYEEAVEAALKYSLENLI